jgi:dCTP diphosphatase
MTRGREDYVNDLRDIIRGFIEDRDWEQFHSPKNLAMALSVEVAEVVEHFQWLTEEQSQNLPPEKLAEVREAIGDVMIYLAELAAKLGIDPVVAARADDFFSSADSAEEGKSLAGAVGNALAILEGVLGDAPAIGAKSVA